MEKILILYSNPSDTERIRLDKEHRAIDEVLNSLKLPADIIIRRHATTFADFTKALAEQQYSVIQFSGHGSPEGICLEAVSRDGSELITSKRISRLLQRTQPNLNLAFFLSCFSAESLPVLVKAASYILTVFGPADDDASINFVRIFYERLLRDHSIEKACFFAQELTRDNLQVVLTRRALEQNKEKSLFQVYPRGNHTGDSFLVDLSQAENDIKSLGVPQESFLSILSRKIRLHSKIFMSPRERAILPIGPFFGIFSWQNPSDPIICHRILRMKPGVDELACEVWASLAVSYNDDAIERYRLQAEPAAPYNDKMLKQAIDRYRKSYSYFSGDKKCIEVLSKNVPEQYKITTSMIYANLDRAEIKLYQEDFPSVVFHLESALSAMHDLLDALTSKLTIDS